MNKCGTWSTANLSFLGRKMCKGRRAISAYTISTHVQVINLQEAPGKAAPEHCIHYRSQELQRCCKFLSAETSDVRSANVAAWRPLSWSRPLNMRQLPKDLHAAWPQDGAVPSPSAGHRARVGRLWPRHAGAILELPMSLPKPWIVRFFWTQIHKFAIVFK